MGNPALTTVPLTVTFAAAPSPTLTLSPTSGTVVDGSTTLAITATRANSTASLNASVSGGGTLSTSAPTSGTPFTYTPPTSGTGTATVTVTDSTDSLTATCTVTYAPPVATPTGGELQVSYSAPSLSTIYFVVTRAPGKSWNGTAFEALTSAHWSTYAIAGSDPGGVRIYTANFPPTVPAGYVTNYAYLRAGGSPASSDTPIGVEADAFWDGTNLTPGGGGSGGGSGVTLAQLNAALAAMLANFLPLPQARGGSATTITLQAGAGSDVVGQSIQIESGTGINQVRTITACDPTTLVATVTPAWTVAPDATSLYRLLPASGSSGSGSGTANFDAGTVSASPVAPTTAGFWATMPDSTAQSGDYTGMSVLFQASGKAPSRKISAHSVVGGLHFFGLTWSGYPLLPSAPAVGDGFKVIP
jgi:hypothetical protein